MNELLQKVEAYYTEKLTTFGPTPQGVDWNGEESQHLRFEQLAKLLSPQGAFSVCDVGCGYGALAAFLAARFPSAEYLGIDVSEEMIATAAVLHPSGKFAAGSSVPHAVDYAVASGIFNVKLDVPADEWAAYVERTLVHLDERTRRGFAFNCLTSYSDPERMRDDLYYADPGALFDLCKGRFSKRVALLHDYPLYEFTILVRK